MATSKPQYQNYVYQSGLLFCALYKRRAIDINGVGIDQWYWMPSNRSGDIIDYRANGLNGFFSSETSALDESTGIPAGYGTLVVDRWQSDKHLSYMYIYPFDVAGLNAFKQSVEEWIEIGANNILIPVFWSDVFTSWSEQQTNADSSWEKQDLLINWIKTKGVKVSLMINLHLGARYIPDFWGTANTEKDCFGDYVSIGGYETGHPSLAGTGANMMKDFYMKVLDRYGGTTGQTYSLGSQLNWITPVFTEQLEYGFNYENGNAGGLHKALYGYSDDSKAGFRSWLQSVDNPDKYNQIADLNAKWGTSFANFGAVTPPSTNHSKGANEYQLSEIFASNWGKDFWKYLAYGQLTKFANDLKTITTTSTATYAPQTKFVLSFGGTTPNDPLCGLRASYDIITFGDVSDGLKTTQFYADTRNNTTAVSLDYMQNYPGKKIMELHHIDFYENGNLPVSVVKPMMIAAGESAMRNGAKDILFIGMALHGVWFEMLKEVMLDLKPKMALNYDNSRQTGGRSTSVTLGALLSSPGGRVGLENWLGVGGSNENRVNFVLDTTVELGTNAFPYSLSLYDNQTYYLKQLDIKNSVYGKPETESGPYNALQQSYNETRVPFLLTAFGITYTAGTKTKSTIEIIDNLGVAWVKMVQAFGVTNTEQNGKYANNHPEFRYIPNIAEDCRFWLPIPSEGGYYDIKITVFDAPCRFDVYHADDKALDRIAYNSGKAYTSAGSTETIRINRSQMQQSNINQRVIKINNNKWS